MNPRATYKLEINEEKKEQIINESLPFIKYTAARLSWRLPPHLTVDDLISVGIMGLLDAIERYDEGIAKLKTFAEFRIKGAMLDELRANDLVPASMKKKASEIRRAHVELERSLGRMPEDHEIADRLNISVDEYYKILQDSDLHLLRFEDFVDDDDEGKRLDLTNCLSNPSEKNPLQLFENKREKELLASMISKLPEKEKLVLSLYYWEELNMKEIAKVLGITEGRVSQLHNQAITRLKSKLKSE